MALPESLSKEYLVIQRCRTFHSWPTGIVFQTGWEMQSLEAPEEATESFIRFQIGTHYTATSNLDPGQTELKGPALCYPTGDDVFFLGHGRFLVKTSSKTSFRLNAYYLEAGMVDFAIAVRSKNTIDTRSLISLLSPRLRRFISFCSVKLNDIIIPVFGVQVLEMTMDEGKEFSSSGEGTIEVRIEERSDLKEKDVVDTVRAFVRSKHKYDDEGWRRFDVACRRYLTALSESDVIDQFCDLWEACEFLTKHIRGKNRKPIRGDVASRVAYALSGNYALDVPSSICMIGPRWRRGNDDRPY